jgi:hypothetical protein
MPTGSPFPDRFAEHLAAVQDWTERAPPQSRPYTARELEHVLNRSMRCLAGPLLLLGWIRTEPPPAWQTLWIPPVAPDRVEAARPTATAPSAASARAPSDP